MRLLPLVVAVALLAVARADDCPPDIANCDYYKRCVAAVRPSETKGEAEAHCAKVHSKAAKEQRDAQWNRFFNADEAGRQEMVREFLLKQCAAGIKNSLCP